jgi:hypothetical protein
MQRLNKPHHVFIGRWSPFHKGHEALIRKVIDEDPAPVLILVRDSDDEWTSTMRREVVAHWLWMNELEGEVIVIPDIKSVNYGRGVGYEVNYIDVDAPVSGTDIRRKIDQGDDSWLEMVPESVATFLSRR